MISRARSGGYRVAIDVASARRNDDLPLWPSPKSRKCGSAAKSSQTGPRSASARPSGAQRSPPAEGSGRLVYILPVVLGLGGLFLAISLALRWSRRPAVAGAAGLLDEDDTLRSRLDDELRDLD